MRRKVAQEMARVFSEVDLLLVPSLRDEMLVITNFTGHPSLTLRAGFVEVSEARSDWAPDPKHPLPKFSPSPRPARHHAHRPSLRRGNARAGRLALSGHLASQRNGHPAFSAPICGKLLTGDPKSDHQLGWMRV